MQAGNQSKLVSKSFPDALLGRKVGMTQVFTPEGEVKGVTVIEIGPCVVLAVRTLLEHGYEGAQLGFVPKKMQRVNKAMTGHFAKVGKGSFYYVKEVRCDVTALGWKVGQEVKVSEMFTKGEIVDVSGTSIGCGFQGVIKRHGMKGFPASRGTHEYERHAGAIGCRKFPGRIFKNKRMPGRMGGDTVTLLNLTVMDIRPEENLLMIQGGIPGSKGALVTIRRAIKAGKAVQSQKKAA